MHWPIALLAGKLGNIQKKELNGTMSLVRDRIGAHYMSGMM